MPAQPPTTSAERLEAALAMRFKQNAGADAIVVSLADLRAVLAEREELLGICRAVLADWHCNRLDHGVSDRLRAALAKLTTTLTPT